MRNWFVTGVLLLSFIVATPFSYAQGDGKDKDPAEEKTDAYAFTPEQEALVKQLTPRVVDFLDIKDSRDFKRIADMKLPLPIEDWPELKSQAEDRKGTYRVSHSVGDSENKGTRVGFKVGFTLNFKDKKGGKEAKLQKGSMQTFFISKGTAGSPGKVVSREKEALKDSCPS